MMDRYNEDVPVLVAQKGPLNGQRWPIRKQLLIGREAGCDIVIPDRQVSRHHARFSLSPDGVRLEDLGSKNGTHCNGQVLNGATLLDDGDMIQIALAQQFVFLSSDATVPLDADFDYDFPHPAEVDHLPAISRLHLDKRSRRVWIRLPDDMFNVGYQEIEVLPPLSVSQFHLLELLYEQQGRVVSRQELIADVWGEEQAVEVSEQALDALVRRLRDRLASVDPTHAYIVTVRGHGLRLENPTV